MKDTQQDPHLSRRKLLGGLAALPAAFHPLSRSAAASHDSSCFEIDPGNTDATRLIILGSGAGPSPMMAGRKRHMSSYAMVNNGAAYLVDCGLGVTNQFARSRLLFSALRSIFITHHHPDHNIEYGPLLLVGWIQGIPDSIRTFGPPPLKQMTDDFLRAYRATIDFWVQDFKVKPLVPPVVTEIAKAETVAQDENVKVTSAIVQHPPLQPALAYRFDFRDRAIVFSGDTAPTNAVARLAKGADTLVHEAMYVPALEEFLHNRIAQGTPVHFDDFIAHMKKVHSPVEEVGRIAQEAGVRTLVLSHLTPSIETIPDSVWVSAAAQHFKGQIVVARDLMVL